MILSVASGMAATRLVNVSGLVMSFSPAITLVYNSAVLHGEDQTYDSTVAETHRWGQL
jgi:hypothetical protein